MCTMIDGNTSLNELFKTAKDATHHLNKNEEYLVKDLFRGFEWNRISKGNRTKLGAMFFAFVNSDGSEEIKPLGKTPQNQQRYKKIK